VRVVYLASGEVEVHVTQGDSWNVPIIAYVGTAEDGNEVTSLSTFTSFTAQIRRSVGSTDALVLEVSRADQDDGILRLKPGAIDTDECEGCYRWGLRAVHPTTGARHWLTGPWIVDRAVVR